MRCVDCVLAIALIASPLLSAGNLNSAVRFISLENSRQVIASDMGGNSYCPITSLPLINDVVHLVPIKRLDVKYIEESKFSQKAISECRKLHEFLVKEIGRDLYHTRPSGVLFFRISGGELRSILIHWDGTERLVGADDLRELMRIIRITRPIPREVDDEVNLAVKLMTVIDGISPGPAKNVTTHAPNNTGTFDANSKK